MTPVEASDKRNEGTVYFNLYGDIETLKQKPKFKIGDKVRISKYNGMCSTRVIHQIGQKRFSQLTKYNTLTQSHTN